MCGIWNLAAVIGHRKSAAGVLDFVRGQDDTTFSLLAFSDIYVSYACTLATSGSQHGKNDVRLVLKFRYLLVSAPFPQALPAVPLR